MLIQKGFKYRLYPTEEQEKLLLQHGGNTRFLWNLFLEQNIEEYKKNRKFLWYYDLANSLPKLKEEHEFLKHSFSQSLQQTARHFDKALKDFLKIEERNFPTFKKKNLYNDSFTCPQKYRLSYSYVFIPKIGEVRWIKHRPLQGKPKKITISQEGDKWYCSVLCEYEKEEKPKQSDNLVGIDLGLKSFAVLSNGKTIKNIRTLKKYEKKLKKESRKLSRKEKCSNNRFKQRLKVSKIHTKIKNIRKDFLHKTTYSIAKNYDGIVLENLNVKGMMRNHNLSKAISDVSWSEFKRQLEYKCRWNDKHFVVIDRFEPTTKVCSDCGCIKEMKLSDRVFECEDCGLILDRDYNAAINILKLGCKQLDISHKNIDFNSSFFNRLGHSRIYACGEEGSGLDRTSFKRNHASMKQEKESQDNLTEATGLAPWSVTDQGLSTMDSPSFAGLTLNGLDVEEELGDIDSDLTDHINSDGSSHTFIDQNVTTSASPDFAGLTVGTETDYSEFEADGTLEFVGDAVVWDDIRVAASNLTKAGNNDPEYTQYKTNGAGSNGIYTWLFVHTADKEVFFEMQLPHKHKAGSDLHVHVHWLPIANGGVGETVSWGLEYSFAQIGGTFGNTTMIYGNSTIPADASIVADRHYITEIGTISTPSGAEYGVSSIWCRIWSIIYAYLQII